MKSHPQGVVGLTPLVDLLYLAHTESVKKKVLKFRNRQFMCKIPDFWLLLQKVHSHVAAELGWLADVLGERPPHTQCSACVDPRNGGDCDYRANHHLEHG